MKYVSSILFLLTCSVNVTLYGMSNIPKDEQWGTSVLSIRKGSIVTCDPDKIAFHSSKGTGINNPVSPKRKKEDEEKNSIDYEMKQCTHRMKQLKETMRHRKETPEQQKAGIDAINKLSTQEAERNLLAVLNNRSKLCGFGVTIQSFSPGLQVNLTMKPEKQRPVNARRAAILLAGMRYSNPPTT